MIKFKEELFEQLVKATQPELLNEILIEKKSVQLFCLFKKIFLY